MSVKPCDPFVATIFVISQGVDSPRYGAVEGRNVVKAFVGTLYRWRHGIWIWILGRVAFVAFDP